MKKEETKKKISIVEWCESHPKTTFAIRCALWCLFAAVLPLIFIAWRYDIFSSTSKISLTGWGFIAIIILIVFVITFIKYAYKSLEPGLLKQCVSGFASIILPLLVLLILVVSIEENISLFKQALGCVILCEIVSIPLNPFPTWIEKKKIEKQDAKINSVADVFWDKFFNKKDGDK